MNAADNFSIIAQNDDFIVIDKLAPLDFHDNEGVSGLYSLVKQWQLSQSDTRSPNEQSQVIYPVHRLDKLTTGLVIFALTKQAASTFGVMFERHTIEKFYVAVADNKPKKKQGWVKGDMAKSRRGSFKLLRTMENPAITQFKSVAIEQGKRLYLLKPHSGKTHQLRVALKSVGAPIMGDPIYHSNQSGKTDIEHTSSENIDRLYLHAWVLQFEFNEQRFSFQAHKPKGLWFNHANVTTQLDEWSSPWTQF